MAECKRCGAIGAGEYTRIVLDEDSNVPIAVTRIECLCGYSEPVDVYAIPFKPGLTAHARGWLWLGLAMAIAAACRWM